MVGICRQLWGILVLALAGAALLGLSASARETIRPNAGLGPTEIRATIVLVNINAVREAENGYEASIYYQLRWTDPRLAGPAAGRPPVSEIWTPIVGIANQQKGYSVFPTKLDIEPDGTVTLRRQVWAALSQPLDLRRFPFDSQTFGVTLLSPSGPDELVFVPDPAAPSGIAETLSVPDWKVSGTVVRSDPVILAQTIPPTAAFALHVSADRRPFYYVYTMILPLIVIAGMSMVAFWIEPENYVTRLGIASTSMLTVVTYRVAAAQILPRSPYFTDLDVFIAGATVLVFAALAAVVLEMLMVRAGRPESARRVDFGARVLLPASFAALGAYAFG